jgi:hypothetical protein
MPEQSEKAEPAAELTDTFNMMKSLFPDFYKGGTDFFEELAAGPLKKMLFEEFPTAEGRKLLLSHKVADKIVFRYFDTMMKSDTVQTRFLVSSSLFIYLLTHFQFSDCVINSLTNQSILFFPILYSFLYSSINH